MNDITLGKNAHHRSAGVIFFALSFITLAVFRLLGTGSISAGFSQILPQFALFLIIAYSVIFNILYLIGAVNMLRLRNWARKLLLLLTALQLAYMLVLSIPLSNRSIEFMRQSPDTQERIWAGYNSIPEKLRLENNITKDEYANLVFKKVYQAANTIRFISIAYLLLAIFFLTRQRVKEQFLRISAPPPEPGGQK